MMTCKKLVEIILLVRPLRGCGTLSIASHAFFGKITNIMKRIIFTQRRFDMHDIIMASTPQGTTLSAQKVRILSLFD